MPLIYTYNTDFNRDYTSRMQTFLEMWKSIFPFHPYLQQEEYEIESVPRYACSLEMYSETFLEDMKIKGMNEILLTTDHRFIGLAHYRLENGQWVMQQSFVAENNTPISDLRFDALYHPPAVLDPAKRWEVRHIIIMYVELLWFHDMDDPTNANDVVMHLYNGARVPFNTPHPKEFYKKGDFDQLIAYIHVMIDQLSGKGCSNCCQKGEKTNAN